MPLSARLFLTALAALAAWTVAVCAQQAADDKPGPLASIKPSTKDDLDHRESLKLYMMGLLQEHDNRLLEAVKTFEQARHLDPEATPLYKKLIPLYLALERTDDALTACRRALDLDPGDHETWYLYARQLKLQSRLKEALAALSRGVACPSLKEHADQHLQMNLELGTLSESTQDFAGAESAFRAVARIFDSPEALLDQGLSSGEEIDAQAVEAYERLGKVCIKAKHYDQAQMAFQTACDKIKAKDPIRAKRFHYNLAEVCLAQDKLAEALAALDQYLVIQPQGTEAYEMKITALKRLDRAGDVVPALRKHIERDPQNTALRLLLAREYSEVGQRAEAEGLYQSLAERSPDAEVYRGLFALYKQEGPAGAEKALTLLDKSLAGAATKANQLGNPGDAARARAMFPALRDDAELVKLLLSAVQRRLRSGTKLERGTLNFLAVLAARARQLEPAEQLYRACLASQEEGPRRAEGDVYEGLLRVLWQAHKHEAVVEVCRQGLEQAEVTSRELFHWHLARALTVLGRADEAVAEADKAIDVARADNRLLFRRTRADVLAQAGRYEQAVAECQALLKEHTQPGEVREIRYTLSGVYSAAKDAAGSTEQLQLILKGDPDDATANNDLGYLWADQNKNLEEAEKLIRKAIELDRRQRTGGPALAGTDPDQDHAAYVDSLGWVLFRRGQLDAARQELEKASSLPDGADDPVVWDHLGDVYARQEEPARARAAWQKAVELYEQTRTRARDDRYKEIKQKLKLQVLDTQH